ncbi:ABC transporter permease [Citricoccus nitrophenolicus]|uniref:Putative ABC transport system permease protein n=1 Tax=Citricoccus muralis TaxID=169134 RepID=A0A3D9L914_9MICC|nr:ABC transporter permease [Citricoccus muralis]REE02340.1 putative ABC transport system permease protein [Citricoccus muralis]
MSSPTFLSLRDVRFSAGRFTLMGAVVGLISLLLVFLTALTNGLAHQNISAVSAWDDAATDSAEVTVAFGAAHASTMDDVETDFTASSVTTGQLEGWRQDAGVEWAEPVGVGQARADSGSAVTAVTLLGLEPDSRLVPGSSGAAADAAGSLEDGALISATAAEQLGVSAGDEVSINGQAVPIAQTIEDSWYSHTPVLYLPLQTWASLTHAPEGTASVLVAGTDPDAGHQPAAAAETITVATDVDGALGALPAYSSENGSLVMMQAFLYGISALVIAAFMAVFTLQRTRDIAVLKALGATTGWVVIDALTQAGIVLLAGAALGGALGLGGISLASGAVPVQVDAAAVAIPVLVTVLLGMVASVAAVWRTCRVDPLVALGGG